MDSEYMPSSDSDIDYTYDFTNSISSNTILEEITENDICSITEDILEEIKCYVQNDILFISSPHFYSSIINNISNIIYDEWIMFGICDEDPDVLLELNEFIEQLLEYYLIFSGIPKRARLYSIDIETNEDIQTISNKLQYLQNIPQPTQKTKEWYEFRNNLISASNLWKVFGTESQRNSLIYEKCQSINTNDFNRVGLDSPLHWGIKYEPLTIMIYENMFSTKIGEFGCIQHKKYSFIGASPDGINIDPTSQRYGRMLEIKNIVNREITGIPKEEYWIQTQIQMETCDLNECDFMETRFLEYSSSDAFYEDSEREYRGVILHFIEKDLKTGAMPIYKYMPLDIILNKNSVDEWISEMKEENREKGLLLFTTYYWYLVEYSCVLIQRNRLWFSNAVIKIEELWRIIEKERIEGYDHRCSKKKISVKMNNDLSNSYVIKNMPLTNSICLVKLE
uniref:YqaJ viral recombinase domain-containing protein n=1 Tax=viral metagenome TaxID=1070528 RepID=A0A6C0JNC0_9ZZZZ